MIRRARLTLKPNVRPGGRSAGSGGRDGVSASQPEEPVQAGDGAGTAGLEERCMGGEKPLCDGGEEQSSRDIPEKAAKASSENEPNKPTATPIQRRKRISTLPNLAKPRVSGSVPVTPSQKLQQVESPPTLPVSSIPCIDEVSSPEKAKVPSSSKSQGSHSAPQGQHVTLPEKRTPIPQVPQFSPYKKASLKHPELSPGKCTDFSQKEDFSPLKERPSQKSSTNGCKTMAPKKLVASGSLEKERLRRAQKLRELLRDELRKERKERKAKNPVVTNTVELERSKMVMRDFIYFIPETNPMTSSFAETKSAEKASTESQLSGTPVKAINNDEDDDLDEEDDEGQTLAPRVKVAEDGSIILDEESLTVEVSRGKAPIVEGNDPIFERGSTTTYSSFRKSTYSKPWSEEETNMFYLAISMVGTDFSMIGQLFPHRERIEIKNKFKREERANSWRIDKAFKERMSFDLEFFSIRLERALEAAKKKRMMPRVRQTHEKKTTKSRKKQKDKAGAEQVLSDGEMAMLSDGEAADARTEEKENEGSVKECLLPSDNVPGKKRRSRKKKNDSKEPEEETCGSLPEDISPLPKKPRKSRSADQVKDTENNENVEDVEAAPDTVREKKKKSRKKKSSDKEMETENAGDCYIIDVPSPLRDGVDERCTNSAFVDDADVLTCRESGEPSFTQSEALTCAEESSLILFTEESECFSEPDDLSSLQESLCVIPGSLTLADQTGTFDDVPEETSQEDSVFDTSHHLNADSPKHIYLEEDITEDSHTQTKEEGSSESLKDSPIRPTALTRSRFQKPRPNVPVRTLARQEKILIPERNDITVERNEVTADDSLSQSNQEDISVPGNLNSEELDLSSHVQKKSFSETSQLLPADLDDIQLDCATTKEDVRKEKPLPVRGRLVRPKPNLRKAPIKDKPPSPPKSDTQYSEEIAKVSCNVVLTPLYTSINEEEAPVKEKAESSTVSQEQCTINSAPLVQECLQRTKPNTGKMSKKKIFEDAEYFEKCGDISVEDATENGSSKLAIQKDTAFGKPTDLLKEVPTSDESCLHQEKRMNLAELDQGLPTGPKPEVSVNLSEMRKPAKTAALTRGRLQRPKPNIGRALPGRGVLSSSDDSRNEAEVEVGEKFHESSQSAASKCDIYKEGKGREDDIKTSSMENLSQCDAEKAPVCTHTDTEDLASPGEISQSYILPLETTVLPGVDQIVSEEHSSVPVENSSHLIIENDLNTSKEERMVAPSPALTRSRLQRPKPNLGRSVTRRVVSAPQKCDDNEERKTARDGTDTSAIEKLGIATDKQSVDLSNESCPTEEHNIHLGKEETQDGSLKGAAQHEESSFTGEKVEGPSVKPPWNRFQKPKPNLGLSVRKDLRTFASAQKEVNVNVDSSCKVSEHLKSKEGPDLVLSNVASGGNREESANAAIKPAQLRRGRLIRPVPSLGKATIKRQSAVQSKSIDEEEVSPTDKDSEVKSSKRKASEYFPDVSTKRSGLTDVSQSSSDSALDHVLSASPLHEGSQSNDILKDIKQQHSRFGRQLKRPVSTKPTLLAKPSENASEHPEKEKTSRNIKSAKSKVAKPTSSKGKGKTTLVKLRAMKQDDDEDDDDAALQYEDEDYDLAPDKMNQAPVFVPFSLRSPKPIPAEIEETVEELEIPMEDLGVPVDTAESLRPQCLSLQDVSQNESVFQADPDNKAHCDGSTEAAMTLISMGNSVFQSKLGEQLDSDQCTESQLPPNTDCKPKASTLSMKMCHDTLALHVGDGVLSISTDKQTNDLVISDLHTSEQPSHLLDVNESCPIIQEDAHQQDCRMSDRLLQDGGSGEETTFILTLVEIPVSEGYPYSCNGNSVEVLPAPVLITSGSSQVLPPDQSSESAASSEPSSESSLSVQGEAKLMQSLLSRKRSASLSSEDEKPQTSKKALLSTSAEEGGNRLNTTAFEENEESSNIPAVIKTEETEECHQSSFDIANSSTGEEKVPECTADHTRLSTVAHLAKPTSTNSDSPSRLLPSSSRTQQRPGRKPLGFLSLVCKEKQSKKTKVTSKKNPSAAKCKKVKVQEAEEHDPKSIHEDVPNNEVPCQSSSSIVSSTPTNTETISSTCQVSENLDTINVSENLDAVTQESPKSQELATEEEAATVSEYFFSDIFMEVDE
ncbi:transcription factor TFIIIB component B'' homolog [Mantella aurantiaca]